jgi:hypothetical protein
MIPVRSIRDPSHCHISQTHIASGCARHDDCALLVAKVVFKALEYPEEASLMHRIFALVPRLFDVFAKRSSDLLSCLELLVESLLSILHHCNEGLGHFSSFDVA